MKYRNLMLAASALSLIAVPALAQTGPDTAFETQLRRVLNNRPEIIIEAVQRAQQRDAQRAEQARNQAAQTVRPRLTGANTPGLVLGDQAANAQNTLVEFLDYRCGYCRQAHTTVKALKAGRPGTRLVVVMRPILGPQSEVLARYALAAAEQGKFEAAHNALFERQVEANDAGLQALSESIGVDWTRARAAMSSPSVTAKLTEHRTISEQMNVNGTPFFITPQGTIPGAATEAQLTAAFRR